MNGALLCPFDKSIDKSYYIDANGNLKRLLSSYMPPNAARMAFLDYSYHSH